jgi:hypothetical protein
MRWCQRPGLLAYLIPSATAMTDKLSKDFEERLAVLRNQSQITQTLIDLEKNYWIRIL